MLKKRPILKMTTLALLAAVGVVLMSYIEIPYPPAPFLKIEVSDFVVMFTFLLFGFKEALLVAVVKTLGDLMFRGAVGPFAVGQITAFIASLSYVFMLYIFNKLIKSDKIGFKVLKYFLVVTGVATIMVIANYFFLTPIFLGKFSFLDMSNDSLASMTGINSYLLSIIILYLPFNFLKGSLISMIAVLFGDVLLNMYRRKLRIEDDYNAT
jgi:riboflavin transporter FmnP